MYYSRAFKIKLDLGRVPANLVCVWHKATQQQRLPLCTCHRIIESLRLEKTTKTIKSNCQSIPTMLTNNWYCLLFCAGHPDPSVIGTSKVWLSSCCKVSRSCFVLACFDFHKQWYFLVLHWCSIIQVHVFNWRIDPADIMSNEPRFGCHSI